MNSEKDIIALEELTAHQARKIDELSDIVANQWLQIEAMQRKLEALTQRFVSLEETMTPPHENTRPPHY